MKWMKYKWLYFLISGVVIIPGMVSLFMFGLKPGIDFTGGSLLEYKFKKSVNPQEIQKSLVDKGYNVSSVQISGNQTYL